MGKSFNFTEEPADGGRGQIRLRVRVLAWPLGSYHRAHGKPANTAVRLSQTARALCRNSFTLASFLHHDLLDFRNQYLARRGLCAWRAAPMARLLGLVLVDRLPDLVGGVAASAPLDRCRG